MTQAEFCRFIETAEGGEGFNAARIKAVCVALRKHRLIGVPERLIQPTAAAWILYSLLGMPSTNYNNALAWIAARLEDEALNDPANQAIPALAHLLSHPDAAADVQAVAVNQNGALIVLFSAFRPLVLPGKTKRPIRPDEGTLGIFPAIRFLGVSEQLSKQTELHYEPRQKNAPQRSNAGV